MDRHKKKTNWRKILFRFRHKAINNPLKYAMYDRNFYSDGYEKKLKFRLKIKFKKLFPDE